MTISEELHQQLTSDETVAVLASIFDLVYKVGQSSQKEMSNRLWWGIKSVENQLQAFGENQVDVWNNTLTNQGYKKTEAAFLSDDMGKSLIRLSREAVTEAIEKKGLTTLTVFKEGLFSSQLSDFNELNKKIGALLNLLVLKDYGIELRFECQFDDYYFIKVEAGIKFKKTSVTPETGEKWTYEWVRLGKANNETAKNFVLKCQSLLNWILFHMFEEYKIREDNSETTRRALEYFNVEGKASSQELTFPEDLLCTLPS